MPSGVTEFLHTYGDADKDLHYERSRSAEILNHQREHSAFRLYQDEESEERSRRHSQMFGFDEEERFIDSPLVVDYQLGLRQSPPPDVFLYSDSPLSHSSNDASNNRDLIYKSSNDNETNISTSLVGSYLSTDDDIFTSPPPSFSNHAHLVEAEPHQCSTNQVVPSITDRQLEITDRSDDVSPSNQAAAFLSDPVRSRPLSESRYDSADEEISRTLTTSERLTQVRETLSKRSGGFIKS